MTPAINNTSQFSQGAPNEKVTKNRNALLAITGVRETNFQQIVEQPDDYKSQIKAGHNDNSHDMSVGMKKTKAGGTGDADEDNFEEDCIASFSDEQDDDQASNNDVNNKSLTLNQQLQRQQRFIQKGGPSTMVIGQKSLISG